MTGGTGIEKEVNAAPTWSASSPNESAIICLIGAVLLEANDGWQLQHRYMQTEPMAKFTPPLIGAVLTQIATIAA